MPTARRIDGDAIPRSSIESADPGWHGDSSIRSGSSIEDMEGQSYPTCPIVLDDRLFFTFNACDFVLLRMFGFSRWRGLVAYGSA